MNEPAILSTHTLHPLGSKLNLAPGVLSTSVSSAEKPTTSGNRVLPPWSTVANSPWPKVTRPLSDIRELTEPSLADLTNRNIDPRRQPSISGLQYPDKKPSFCCQSSIGRKNSWRELVGQERLGPARVAQFDTNHHLGSSERTDAASSLHSVDLYNFSRRESSRQAGGKDRGRSVPRRTNLCIHPPPPRGLGYTVRNRGRSKSPIKDTHNGDTMQRVPSRTFIRTAEANFDILDFPRHQHPRISLELHAAASIFVGGGSVEGHIRLVVNDFDRVRHRRQLAISRISIDLLGVEEISNSRRNIFLNLATELIDTQNPPPHNMVESLKQISPIDPFWLLVPSVSHQAFILSLPLDVGPPPFYSKAAKIKYVLSATALVRDQGKQYLVRSSQEVSVLSVYDPEKALVSLPSPLTASDEYVRWKDHGFESVRVTAGLHRQVWVSGTSIFVDVHIVNKSKKTVKRLELQLERDLLCYKHVAASTLEQSASQARIFDSNERAILSKSVMKQGSCGWAGVVAHSSDTRTCDLELPRGHVTVKCGKYFELPIVLIHMNSLDVVPNSVAQVAAAIEEKRARVSHQRNVSMRRTRSHDGCHTGLTSTARTVSRIGSPNKVSRQPSVSGSVQGRAFVAPRKQSLDRVHQEIEASQEMDRSLDTSPRKYLYSPHNRNIAGTSQLSHQASSSVGEVYNCRTPSSNHKARILTDEVGDDVVNICSRPRRMRSTETVRSATTLGRHRHESTTEEGVPRLQRNTSTQSKRSKSSKLGFKELDIKSLHPIDMRSRDETSLGREGWTTRFDDLRAANGRSKVKSSERWKAGGWFGSGTERKERRELERANKERIPESWI